MRKGLAAMDQTMSRYNRRHGRDCLELTHRDSGCKFSVNFVAGTEGVGHRWDSSWNAITDREFCRSITGCHDAFTHALQIASAAMARHRKKSVDRRIDRGSEANAEHCSQLRVNQKGKRSPEVTEGSSKVNLHITQL